MVVKVENHLVKYDIALSEPVRPSEVCSSSEITGMLLRFTVSAREMRLTEKVAWIEIAIQYNFIAGGTSQTFNAGSSKQGNALLAAVD